MIIKQIASDDDARRFLNSVPYPEFVPDWLPLTTDHSLILGVYSSDLVGAFPLQKHVDCIEIHAAFLPEYRGRFAVDAAHKAFEWIWANTNYKRIIADISDPKIEAVCAALRNGENKQILRGIPWAVL